MHYSEKEQFAINYIKPLTENIEHSGTDFFSHLFGTFQILKKRNCDERVCLAGLYHAIYETAYFRHNIEVDCEEIHKIIGDYAHKLIKIFSLPKRANVIIDNTLELDIEMQKHLLFLLHANLMEQIPRIFDKEEVNRLNNLVEIINLKIVELETLSNDLT